MSEADSLDVIAVGAHPDDVEIACGGTLAKLVRQGYRVGIIDLTDGEPTPLSPGPEVRMEEAKAAAEVLGAHRVTLDLPNRRLFDNFEARVALAKEFRKYRPKIVIGFGDKTPMASPDHWQAMQITDAALLSLSIRAPDSGRIRQSIHGRYHAFAGGKTRVDRVLRDTISRIEAARLRTSPQRRDFRRYRLRLWRR